ncbi:MAG TPA: RnfABCDGE type electron transport complex subunit A [Dictyoglomaceae bacterium]|nr:RnfABCDGE type electron transport complex subunit A [Dictyoglomaceae bacterium]HOL38724.1 RnfABCDGE type electron transport complex subunit A [Dictyoglomaceae bacterium]HOP94572.1 RnfABCDGE type electron transport complex subunit A [Dictyoglomaceae bacterium]HPP15527.1 RnfABCDGE type electron transport complex subunit A [Dictyoglomaceae bacterium]HPU42842.1 RnfABCDGE type electron transport complex subunit A [Dictyoglomaceae bacterium]
MESLMKLFSLFFFAMIVDNIIFMRFLALCSYVGMTSQFDTSVGMGFAVTFVMVMASVVTFFVYYYILLPLNLVFLRTLTFILVIAVLVQLVEMVIRKTSPYLYKAMGIYLPLITTNCAILAVTFLNIDYHYNLLETIVYSIGVSLGYTIALILLSSIRERLAYSDTPKFWQGYPIVFITSGLLALVFLGFQGMAH